MRLLGGSGNGKVVEAGSGALIAGAGVEYQLCQDSSPYFDRSFAAQIYWGAEYRKIVTGSDGSFQMAVVPGPGHLMVKAPTPDFVSRYVSHGRLQFNKPGGFLYVLEGLARIDPKPGTKAVDVTIPLHRGLTVRGRVAGPHGEVVEKGFLVTSQPQFSLMNRADHIFAKPIRDGRFELSGCDPSKPLRICLLDAEHQWGATVTLDATEAQREPPSVRLRPCGSAAVRFVDERGELLADHPLLGRVPDMSVAFVLVEGAVNAVYGQQDSRHVRLTMWGLDNRRYRDLRTDDAGRVTFPTLVPGAPYKLFIRDATKREPGEPEEKEYDFTVEPGQTVDLGDITVTRHSRK